jgi:hypothetical protein
VQFSTEAEALNGGWISTPGAGSALIGVDAATVYTYPSPVGRPSVRLVSNATYNRGLFILDLEQMPFGCGIWPTFGLVSQNWPDGGEIGMEAGQFQLL